MKEFTYSEARQGFAALLECARCDGAVRIRRRDGKVFVLRPDSERSSPLDVPGINLDLTAEELVSIVHEGRRPLKCASCGSHRFRGRGFLGGRRLLC